jgi:hypothetical protein
MQVAEIQALHGAYIRLTEKFKALWTFHQFIKGVHQTFLGDAPPYAIDFNSIYEKLRLLSSEVSSSAPPERLREKIAKLESDFLTFARTLRLSDRSLSPSLVRRFFEKVRPQDEKIVYQLLRFYFAQPDLDDDLSDKVDFLATIVATAPGGEGLIPRSTADVQKTFEAIAASCPWPESDAGVVETMTRAFEELSGDVGRARSVDERVSGKLLENVRTLKHRLGYALGNPKVLAAVGICNVQTKAVFRRLYEDEKKKIDETSARIEVLEKEFAKGGRSALPEEFVRFRTTQQEFLKREGEANVRARDVLAMKNLMSDVLTKFDLGAIEPDEVEEALEISEEALDLASEENSAALENAIQKILAAVEMGEGGPLAIGHLGLEAWELRTAKRAIAAGGRAPGDRDQLVLEAAAIRVKAEEEAARWRQAKKMGRPVEGLVHDVRQTLLLAAETDHRFATLVQEAAEDSSAEEVRTLVRSRFKLLRAYSGLWLLHDGHASQAKERLTQG